MTKRKTEAEKAATKKKAPKKKADDYITVQRKSNGCVLVTDGVKKKEFKNKKSAIEAYPELAGEI